MKILTLLTLFAFAFSGTNVAFSSNSEKVTIEKENLAHNTAIKTHNGNSSLSVKDFDSTNLQLWKHNGKRNNVEFIILPRVGHVVNAPRLAKRAFEIFKYLQKR